MVGFGSVLRRGVAAGAAAGLVAALVIWLAVEPVIRRALVIEDARGHAGGQSAPIPALHAHGGGEELVTRTQQVIGGAVTSVLVGVAFGVIFAIVFAKARPRVPGASDFSRSIGLGAIAFGAVALLPTITMPANPPAVGDPATVGRRTALYALSVLLGAAIAVAVPMLDRWLAGRRVTDATRWTVDILAVVAAVVLVVALLPGTPDAVPLDVPAALLWDFRIASLAQLAAMWLTLAVTFGLLLERATASGRAPALERQPAAA